MMDHLSINKTRTAQSPTPGPTQATVLLITKVFKFQFHVSIKFTSVLSFPQILVRVVPTIVDEEQVDTEVVNEGPTEEEATTTTTREADTVVIAIVKATVVVMKETITKVKETTNNSKIGTRTVAVALANAMVLIVDTTTATKVMEVLSNEAGKDETITKAASSNSKDLIRDPIEETMLVMALTLLVATTVADNLNAALPEVRLEVEPEIPRMRIATPLPIRTNRRLQPV